MWVGAMEGGNKRERNGMGGRRGQKKREKTKKEMKGEDEKN